MESFKHDGFDEVDFWTVTGEVLSSDKRSETHVSSSGGGGYVNRHGGIIAAPEIRSTTVTKHEFWIKKEDGDEESINLTGIDIPLREGQRVSLTYAKKKGENSGYLAFLVNHNANKYWHIRDATKLRSSLGLRLTKTFSRVLLLTMWLGIWLLGYGVMNSLNGSLLTKEVQSCQEKQFVPDGHGGHDVTLRNPICHTEKIPMYYPGDISTALTGAVLVLGFISLFSLYGRDESRISKATNAMQKHLDNLAMSALKKS